MAKTNPRLIKLIESLKAKSREEDVLVWRDVAKRLERPTRNYPKVNLGKINRNTKKNETVLVPGKVLSAGILDHPVIIAGLGFSKATADKIKSVKGKCITIEQLMEDDPKGSSVRIIQ